MALKAYSLSVAKEATSHNSDTLLVDDARRLFLVADGQGDGAAGKIASEAASQLISNQVDENKGLLDSFDAGEIGREEVLSFLEKTVQEVCRSVYDMSQTSPQNRGMHTTLSVLLLTRQRGFIAHVGNSRIYIYRQTELVQLTEDHSVIGELIRQGRLKPDQDGRQLQSDSLTRCLGLYPHVQVDTFDFELAAGDTFILATRGIWGALNGAQELADVLETKGYPDAPSTLVSLRDARKRQEDASVIITRIIASRGEMDAPNPDDLSLKLKVLKQIPLFQHLSYVQLVAVLNVSDVRSYPKGTHIFQEGQLGESLFVVLDGKVGIEKNGVSLATLGSGALFGEMAIMDKAPRSALALSTEDARLIEVGRSQLFALMRQEKDIAVKLLWCFVQVLNQRLRSTSSDLMKLREGASEELTSFNGDEDISN